MNAEFFAAIEDIEKEKGIPRAYMYDQIRQAMLAAFRRDHPENEDNVEIILDEEKKRIDMQVNKLVVEEVTDPAHEIDQDAAKKYSKRAKPGDTVSIPVETKKFGRIAAQAAKQVRTLVVDGVLNYDDIKVIKSIADRSRCENERGKSVENYLDLDLSHAHFANTWRTDRYAVASELFYGMSALRSVRLPVDVREVGKKAFYNCRRLVTVEMSQGVRVLGEEAFSGCSRLKHVSPTTSPSSAMRRSMAARSPRCSCRRGCRLWVTMPLETTNSDNSSCRRLPRW